MLRKWMFASILTLGFTLSAGSYSLAGPPGPTLLPVLPNPGITTLRPGPFPSHRFDIYQVVYRRCEHDPWVTFRIYRNKCDARDAARYLRSLGYQVRIWD